MSKIPPVPKTEYPELDKAARTHIAVLRERRNYLIEKLKNASRAAASYHEAEIAAINWVLTDIGEAYRDS